MLVVVVVFAAVLVVFVRVIAVVLLVVLFVAELLVKPEAIVVLDVTTGLDVVVVAAIVVLAGVRRTFIKSHNNIGADTALYIHYFFGGKEMPATIDMRLEKGALFGELAVGCQRKYLVAAAVGKHRLVPAIKLVNAACRF